MTATLPHPTTWDVVSPDPEATPRAGTARRPWKIIVAAGVFAVLAVEVVRVAPSLRGALTSLAQANPAWLAVAVVSAAGSMSMFARSRRRLLRAAGVHVPVRSAVAAVYVANALHTTLPGGAAFSTGYTYRWMRGWGASRPAAMWTLAAGGVVASASLAGLGVLGSLLVGGSAGWMSLLTATAGVVAVGFGARVFHRSPDAAVAIGRRLVAVANAVRRRPADEGLEAVREMIVQLRTVRPTGRDWLASAGCATANWALDAACLAGCAAALGVSGFSLPLLLLTYTAGMAAASLSLLPGGLGVVDAALVLTMVAGGIPAAAAIPVVLLYRLISLGGVVAAGWVVAGIKARTPHAPPLPTTGAARAA